MKLLILGARGMLGSALSDIFQDHNPICWDRAELDITDGHAVQKRIGELKPAVVINAAAYTNVDEAESNRAAAFAVNEVGVRKVAQAAREIDATLIHYSTDYIFPGDRQQGYSENDRPGPAVNVYGESKLAGEQALLDIAPRLYVLRTAWLYGSGGKNFVDTMLRLAGEQAELTVINDQQGSPTFTKDVARATKTILEQGYQPGIYHTVNDGIASWYDFALEIFRIKDIKITVRSVSSEVFVRPARRPRYSVLRNTRGPLLRPWKEALAEYLA
jgi:dTDP-4-dehydrorhamnose reductase